MTDERRTVEGGEELLQDFLSDVHRTAPMGLPSLAERYAAKLGVGRVVIYLVDLQQQWLTALAGREKLRIDSSKAGWAYRSLALQVEETDEEGVLIWVPLVDGENRLGVVACSLPSLDTALLRRLRALASVLALAITSKRAFSDQFVQQSRTGTMSLPSEMVRALLPPHTIGGDRVVSTAVLEPAYELGGDAFDHALTESTLHVVILDAMGHDLASGLTTATAMAGCRSRRRMGAGLRDLVTTVDDVLAQWLPDQFCTGITAELDLSSGVLSWCNGGHPPPLLIRDDRVLERALERPGEPPMGTPARLVGIQREVHEVTLQPGDRVLFYTDGVTEARLAGGPQFGLEQFSEYIIRATAAGELTAEALRRLMHSILERHRFSLTDDATILLVEWRGPDRHR